MAPLCSFLAKTLRINKSDSKNFSKIYLSESKLNYMVVTLIDKISTLNMVGVKAIGN